MKTLGQFLKELLEEFLEELLEEFVMKLSGEFLEEILDEKNHRATPKEIPDNLWRNSRRISWRNI